MGIGTVRNTAIFLDRDGVLNLPIIKNNKPYPPATIDEVKIAEDVRPALDLFRSLGFFLIVVSNQPDVARGTTDRLSVENINRVLNHSLPIDDFFICYHDDQDLCACRKPSPGLLIEAANKYHIDLHKSFMVGDRWKDIAAGKTATCKTIFLNYNYNEQQPDCPDFTTTSLLAAAMWVKNIVHQEESNENP